jgi:chromosome segregation ATPase
MRKYLATPLLALVLAAPVGAEEITTSRGVTHLPPALSLTTEPALTSAATQAEQTLIVLMRDIAEVEKQRRSVAAEATSVADKVKGTRADIEKLRTDYEAADKAYRDDVAVYESDQAAWQAQLNKQRADAAVQEALPSAQRDINEVLRLNDLANKLAAKRTELDTRRTALMKNREDVEAKRLALTDAKAKADRGLADSRSSVLGDANSADTKMAAAREQLRACVNYMDRVRGYLATRAKAKVPASPILAQAKQVLARLDAARK